MTKELNLRKVIYGHSPSIYGLPMYDLTNEGLVENPNSILVHMVRGKIEDEDSNQQGTTSETMISMLIEHLSIINCGDLYNMETANAITKLQEALFWIEERKRDRDKRGVSGTKKR